MLPPAADPEVPPAVQPPAAPAAPADQKNTVTDGDGGADLGTYGAMSNRDLLAWLALGSGVYMVEIANLFSQFYKYHPTQIQSYEVSLGAVSTTFALVAFAAESRSPGLSGPGFKAVVTFLFLWWFAGVVVTTFFGSFQTLAFANGYFGSWFSFAVSTVLLLKNVAEARAATKNVPGVSVTHRPLVGLLFASIVVIGASIAPCSPQSVCNQSRAFAVCLGSISAFFSALFLVLYGRISARALQMSSLIMGLWWVVGTGVVTFDQPFYSAGNGYFACFASIFFSYGFFKDAHAVPAQ